MSAVHCLLSTVHCPLIRSGATDGKPRSHSFFKNRMPIGGKLLVLKACVGDFLIQTSIMN